MPDAVACSGNTVAKAAITPSCLSQLQGVVPGGPLNGNTYTAWVQCTAYNGDIGTRATVITWPPTSNPFDIAGASADASRVLRVLHLVRQRWCHRLPAPAGCASGGLAGREVKRLDSQRGLS